MKYIANFIIVVFLVSSISSCSSSQTMMGKMRGKLQGTSQHKGISEFESCKMMYVGKTFEIKKYFEKKTEQENIDCTKYQGQLEDYFVSLNKKSRPSTMSILNFLVSLGLVAGILDDDSEVTVIGPEQD
ncbi:uncharacterized protein METZ01_LOCUS356413 [marine metagenome]|uniref:Lipoprotein n=1 Tax=marine metagenome TaxID=408172 RepID=A0A382S0U5_9ZZZZ